MNKQGSFVKDSITILGLLALATVLTAQDASGPPVSLRFSLVLPKNVPSEGVQIRYFALGAQGGYGSFLKPEPRLNAYELEAPGARVKVIAYLPGCQFDTLDLTPEMPKTQALDCRPLRPVMLSGQIIPSHVRVGKGTEVEASYLAYWAHEFFGIMDGMVATFRVAAAAPSEDGAFKLSLPDFAEDAVSTRWGLKEGEWRLLLREVRTGNILAILKATGQGSNRVGLEVRASYPEVVGFEAVPPQSMYQKKTKKSKNKKEDTIGLLRGSIPHLAAELPSLGILKLLWR